MLAYGNLVDPLVDLTAFIILALSIYSILKQQKSQQQDVKKLLLLVYAMFEGVMVLEILRGFVTNNTFIYVYAVGGISLILWLVGLLTIVGAFVYIKPSGSTARERYRNILSNFPHGVIITVFLSFIFYSDYSFLTGPNSFKIVALPNVFGDSSLVKTVSVSTSWLADAFIVLVFFIGYSTSLFVLTARKSPSRSARRALYTIPISWITIGAELIVFNGYLVQLGYDALGIGYMIAAIAFAVAGYSFRDTSTMASIFSPIEHEILPVSNPFSARIGADKTTVASKQIFLLMVDSTAQFENVVKDFAVEQISNRIPVFLFSSKANPVYRVLSGMEGARFYTTSDVSYPKPTDQPYEILVPQNDQAVLIDVIRKTVSAAPEAAIIYDNISDILVSWGTGEAYKFLKAAREVLEHQVSGLFILTEGAHDQNSVNIIKTLFENHLHYGKDGLKVLKQLEPIAAV